MPLLACADAAPEHRVPWLKNRAMIVEYETSSGTDLLGLLELWLINAVADVLLSPILLISCTRHRIMRSIVKIVQVVTELWLLFR